MAVDPKWKKGQLIDAGEGRGGYADGKGGFTKEDPMAGGNPDFDPSKIVLPTDQERALYEQLTQGSPEAQAAAREQIKAMIGADEGPVWAAWLAKASGHQ